MKSRRTSRGPHKTQSGRVVYDRKQHSFNLKDVMRIAVNIDVDATPTEIVSGVGILNQLLVKMILALADKVAPSERWSVASAAITGLIDAVWGAAISVLNAAEKIES